MLKKQPGFTLVELLIALVVVGILAGALLLVSAAGADKAQASRVVSDLRNLKAAAVQYNASSGAWPASVTDLSDYLDGPLECAGPVCYEVASGESGNFVGFRADLSKVSTGVKGRLKGMAETVSLYSDTELIRTYAGEAQAVYPVGYAGSGRMAAAGGTPGSSETGGGGSGETSGSGETPGSGGTPTEGTGGDGSGGTSSPLSPSDPGYWTTPHAGLKITETPEGLQVQPESGWMIKGTTLDGKSFTLTSGSGFTLIYRGADGNWYFKKNNSETPINIGSIQIIKT